MTVMRRLADRCRASRPVTHREVVAQSDSGRAESGGGLSLSRTTHAAAAARRSGRPRGLALSRDPAP